MMILDSGLFLGHPVHKPQ